MQDLRPHFSLKPITTPIVIQALFVLLIPPYFHRYGIYNRYYLYCYYPFVLLPFIINITNTLQLYKCLCQGYGINKFKLSIVWHNLCQNIYYLLYKTILGSNIHTQIFLLVSTDLQPNALEQSLMCIDIMS